MSIHDNEKVQYYREAQAACERFTDRAVCDVSLEGLNILHRVARYLRQRRADAEREVEYRNSFVGRVRALLGILPKETA